MNWSSPAMLGSSGMGRSCHGPEHGPPRTTRRSSARLRCADDGADVRRRPAGIPTEGRSAMTDPNQGYPPPGQQPPPGYPANPQGYPSAPPPGQQPPPGYPSGPPGYPSAPASGYPSAPPPGYPQAGY